LSEFKPTFDNSVLFRFPRVVYSIDAFLLDNWHKYEPIFEYFSILKFREILKDVRKTKE